MELNGMEKRILFQAEGDCRTEILHELLMTAQYAKGPVRRKTADGLMEKLSLQPDKQCMELVRDIQKNYQLPKEGRTIGEMIAEARQKSGAEKLKGHDIMALERYDPEVKHMIIFDVLSGDSPVGDKGDRMRLFLTETGYSEFLDSQKRGEVRLKKHASVSEGYLRYDCKEHTL